MSPLCIAPVVEGHGEIDAVPILIRRISAELYSRGDVNVLRPIRVPRSKLAKPAELLRAVSLADLKLRQVNAVGGLVLVVFDADEDPACEVAPKLLRCVATERPDVDVAVVLAVTEYETWFVAAAASLSDYLTASEADIPADPDGSGAKKGWLQRHFKGRYTETIEQPALTARMDLIACRARSRSFDKLCRELEKRLTGSAAPA